ncbi:Cobalt-zinc-cadmium resistance protein CzcB [Rubinisphaera italica]|uniref:Cobalt-zinc-cadmium resistance protein CzcB n=2 Tax=Rubinisphaera italica TaxID=2527969 RepID=A0A5C5XCH2_9PLAN|nr:Cobalt-zinc-cadmium resistance protein CzcB [Rubinisphaera italica]
MNYISKSANKNDLLHSLLKGLPTILVLAVMGAAWMIMHHINSSGGSSEESVETTGESEESDTITLPEGKFKTGKFESVPAEQRSVQHVHTVPGRLRYDQTKHVDVKAPMDGILTEVLVTPGDFVNTGDLIAVIRSPEIGQARAEILKRQQQREIALKVLEREELLDSNLKQLSAMLEEGKSVKEIEAASANLALGSYRQEILSAYSNLVLAKELTEKIRPLVESGSVPGRTLKERENERQLAETSFLTARDLAKFSVTQAKMKAEADVSEADRQLNLAWQSLETLLGYKENKETANLSDEESLSRLEVRAPFAGNVESRDFANNERVVRGASLVVLANTETLYVEASIRESDWSAMELKQGTIVKVLVPALDDRTFEAKVHYVGREVQAETNSVPLVATIENQEGLLRPGMYVRVTIPIGTPHEALSVKPESIIQHENQQFVFVDMQGGKFKRYDISTGQTSEDWVEVTDGLSTGQMIVTDGAFLLKSEFLLRGEGE